MLAAKSARKHAHMGLIDDQAQTSTNFPKNLVLADKIKAIADKYKATPSQIALVWILAEDEKCMYCLMFLLE